MLSRTVLSSMCALLIPVFASGCLSGSDGDTHSVGEAAQSSSSARDYSGRELFKGAVLGRGAAASLLSDPAKSGSLLDDSQSQADFEEGLYSLQRAARADGAPDAVIEKLEALSTRARNGELTPAILAKLADDGADSTLEAIQAKDPNYFSSFKREVTSGNNARVDAALRHGADLVGALAPTAGTQAANQAGPDCLVVLVAVAAIAVYAKFYYKPDPQVAGANSSLQHDMAVDRLTTSLKGA